MPQPTNRPSKLLQAGLHVAPFLSPAGRLVLLAISKNHHLDVAVEIQQMTGCRRYGSDYEFNQADQSARFYARNCLSAWSLEPQAEQHGYIPYLNPGNAGPGHRALARIQLAPGVHLAPWSASWHGPAGGYRTIRPLLAIDEHHRLVAEMNALPEDVESARRELMAFLATPSDPDEIDTRGSVTTYVDPYDDGEPDDCCGEGWKR